MDTFADSDFPNMLGKMIISLKTWFTGWVSRPAMRWRKISRLCWQMKYFLLSGGTVHI